MSQHEQQILISEPAPPEFKSKIDRNDLIVYAYVKKNRNLREIGRAFNMSHESVRLILLKHGVQLRGRGRPAK